MSTKALSPTANLLRSSRFFSIPSPLPKPVYEFRSSVTASSDGTSPTATTPYPTHQAITTPPSSLSRGDWGLKRPLPLKSTTKAKNPALRINAVDTIEHVTDFDPATNHSETVKKWQALDIPTTTYVPQDRVLRTTQSPRSVYENEFDNTYDTQKAKHSSTSSTSKYANRWRFGGPWLAGMDKTEFEAFAKKLRTRRPEFLAIVRKQLRAQKHSELTDKARAAGGARQIPLEQVEVSEQELNEYLKTLRSDFSLGSPLAHTIRAFLDLPDLPTDTTLSFSRLSSAQSMNAARDVFQTSVHGPPKTHPGAGLSYIRTGAILNNHPILGPRANRPPVQARVLVPRNKSGKALRAVLGVGGVLTHEPPATTTVKVGVPLSEYRERGEPGVNRHDFNSEGGTKVWVEPERASIDSRGQIQLVVNNADRRNVGMHTGEFISSALEATARASSARAVPFSAEELKAIGVQENTDSIPRRAGKRSMKSYEAIRALESVLPGNKLFDEIER